MRVCCKRKGDTNRPDLRKDCASRYLRFGEMKKSEVNPYAATLGNYVPICGGKLLFNHCGDTYVYYSILFVCFGALPFYVDRSSYHRLVSQCVFLDVRLAFSFYSCRKDVGWFLVVILYLLNVLLPFRSPSQC